MAPVSNRFAKYIIQPDTAGGGSAPAPKANRFAKYKAGEAPAVQQANPMVAQGQAAQQAWRDGGAKPANPNPENPIITAQRNSQAQANSAFHEERRPRTDAELAAAKAAKSAAFSRAVGEMGFAPDVMPTQSFDDQGNVTSMGELDKALPWRFGASAVNAAGPGSANAILEIGDAAFGPGLPFDYAGNELDFSKKPQPRITFGGDGRPEVPKPPRMLPTVPLTPARDAAEMTADFGGTLFGALAGPGKAVPKEAGLGKVASQIGAKGTPVAKGLGFGTRTAGNIIENVGYAGVIGANMAPDGQRAETAAQFMADPLTWAVGPGASLIYRGSIALKTMGRRVTPEYVQLQQAMQTLQRGNATPEQVRQAVATINKITPPRPAETAPLAGAADEAPGAQNAPAPVQGRSDAAIGAAKQQAETRAQLQAALDAANARGDREAAAQLESQLRDSTFIIDPQTGQRAGAATRAAQPQPIPTATQTAAGAPPIQPPPPAVASANAAVPTPGVVPPAGNLVPIPQNEAVAAFNALPPKTREAMLRTLNSAGMDANGFWSDTWRKLTGRFRNSSEAMDAIRKLGDMPEDQQVMFALQLIKNNGGDLETILPAMGRKWATEGARDPQLFGGTDRAREIMDANVPKVINSQGERVAGIAEDKFGPGIVPAGEAIDVEKRVLAKQYDTLLNPQRKQYGRLRNPQKLASIDKAWNDIKAYLKRPEVIDQMPDWVKLKVMQRASEDMRNIGFTDAEMSTILAGDGAVLAPLFEASGPLTWSPQMWTHLVDQYPTQAAHVLQSAYREAADGLMSGVSRTQADVTNAQYLMRLRGESGKGGLVDMLERAIPGKGGKIDGEGGYQWTRTNFGDNRSAERAFDILERFKTAANSEGDVAAIIKELKDLPARHREAAENQITSLIRQELGRKVDNVKLSELDNPDRLSAPNLTALSNQNFLNALEDVFGPRGKELADGIRLARASTDTLTSISPKYNSRTQLNAEDVKNAGARYEDPAGAEGGVIDKTVGGLASGGLATGGAAALGISAAGGLTVPLLGLAAGKALYNAYKAGKRLSNTERNQLVDFLFRARKAGEGDPLPRKINHGNVLRSVAVNAAVGGTIGGLSSEGDPNAIAAGIVGGAGFGAARKIIRSRSSLIKPPGPVGPRLGPRGPATPVNALRGPGGSTPPSSPANALSTPPRPPVKAGFGSSSLDMSEPARMQRAREQGFDVETPLYHGTAVEVDAFDPAKRGGVTNARSAKLGTWLTENPQTASGYADLASQKPVADLIKKSEAAERAGQWDKANEYMVQAEKLEASGGAGGQNTIPLYVRGKMKTVDMDGVRYDPDDHDLSGMVRAAKAEGFDGVRFENFSDEAEWGVHRPTTHVVIFDPANIRGKFAKFDPSQSGSSKLLAGMGGRVSGQLGPPAAAATIASVGPEGESNEDKLKRMATWAAVASGVRNAGAIGRMGRVGDDVAQSTFGGVKAKTADLKLHRIAQDMERAGASRDQIIRETGWFKGVDGQWKFEIDDRKAGLKGPRRKMFAGPLKNVMTDGDAGGAYPKVGKTFTIVDPHPFGNRPNAVLRSAEGKSPASIIVEVPHNSEMKGRSAYGKPYDQEGLGREMLLHERQHVIQDAEGFAKGGSPREAASIYYAEQAGPIKARIAALEEQAVGLSRGSDEFKRLSSEAHRLKDDLDRLDNLNEVDIYNRLAGEVEARNVQARRDFTPEDRRAKPPWTTQDTPDERQIVQYGAGKQESRGFGGGGKGPPQPQANALASPPKKPRPVEARREAPRGNKPFNNPSLSQGENKISEMLLNGYEYPAIADEMMTSVDVVKQLAKRAQDKLGDAVKLPRPGMGKRPVGSTKREAAFGLFDEGLDNATIAQRTGLSLGNVRTYRSYWKQESGAPVANVNGASYNPPEMPPRPFEADYPQKDWPNGPPVDAQGRLVFDMEGRPLNQNATIVGRSKAPGVGSQSEADRPLRDKTATIQTLRNTGSEFERTPRENLPGQTDGYWNPSYADNGRFTGRGSAVIADDLDRPVMGLDDQELMTIAHELAHNIDFKTNPARSVDDYNARKWGIDPADSPGKAKVNDQLLRIYRDLNNAPGAEAKIGRPLDRGYQQAEEARELWAEAIRAYMWDPNYIKTVAPDVAFMIRHHVNRNSSLRKTIQFNAIPTIVGVGGLGLGAAALNGQPAEAKTRSSGMRANALAPAQNNRP